MFLLVNIQFPWDRRRYDVRTCREINVKVRLTQDSSCYNIPKTRMGAFPYKVANTGEILDIFTFNIFATNHKFNQKRKLRQIDFGSNININHLSSQNKIISDICFPIHIQISHMNFFKFFLNYFFPTHEIRSSWFEFQILQKNTRLKKSYPSIICRNCQTKNQDYIKLEMVLSIAQNHPFSHVDNCCPQFTRKVDKGEIRSSHSQVEHCS